METLESVAFLIHFALKNLDTFVIIAVVIIFNAEAISRTKHLQDVRAR